MTYDNTGHPQGGGQAPQGNPNGAPYQPQSPGAMTMGFQQQQQFNQQYMQQPQQQQQFQQPQQYAPGTQFVQDATGNFVPVVAQQGQQVQPVMQPQEQEQVAVATEARSQVEGFLKTAGIQASQVEQEIAALGGLSDATKKALVDKHGAATANLIFNQINSIAQAEQARGQQLQQMQWDMVGEAFKGVTEQTPQESWNELLTWSRENIDQDTRRELNSMMRAGGFQAKQAVKYMIDTLKSKQGMEQHGQLLNGDNLNQAQSGNTELSASAYSRELDKVVAKHGYDSPERRALDARRNASRQRGH